jgi:hypothetical protein
MTRGKYAAKAAHRRTLAENEERADVAERAQAKAERELAEYREKAEAKIARLERQLTTAVADRDEGSSPLIRELTGRVEGFRRKLVEADEARKVDLERWRELCDGFKNYLTKVDGLTLAEAWEVMINCASGKQQTTHIMTMPNGTSVKAELAIGAARGNRSGRDLLTEIFTSLNDGVAPAPSGEGIRKVGRSYLEHVQVTDAE